MPNNYTKKWEGCLASVIDHYSACGQNDPVICLEYMLLEHKIKQCFADQNSYDKISEAITSSLLEEGWQLPECKAFEKCKAWLQALDHFVSKLDDGKHSLLVDEAKVFVDSF